MEDFAKIYDTSEFGQILVKLDTNSETGFSEIRFYFKQEGFGVCSITINYVDDNEETITGSQKTFNNTTLTQALSLVREASNKIAEVTKEQNGI